MRLMFKQHFFIALILLTLNAKIEAETQQEFEEKIIFYSVNSTGFEFVSTFDDNEQLLESCDPEGNFTLITHGHEGSIQDDWTKGMIGNFTKARGGCVFFMDYFHYSKVRYFKLVKSFEGIQQVATKKLIQLYDLGFKPKNGYLFGFSYGAHLMFEAGYQFYESTGEKIFRIDACDPAGPGFPRKSRPVQHAKDSAEVVQCIHTSCGYGTCEKYCHYDVLMGSCGKEQVGESKAMTSHVMCPYIYMASFDLDYPLVPKPGSCPRSKLNKLNSAHLLTLDTQLMGFRFNTSLPNGHYFSKTCKKYPWTCKEKIKQD